MGIIEQYERLSFFNLIPFLTNKHSDRKTIAVFTNAMLDIVIA